ncbi:MAG TPA: YifB family Mg chelatase-like AAA ATPase [Chthoniobacteraceae bacterium]|nr:YifB family Mg chelatase-like AAA ATPase [Chthoniobacteraceae bacterium]
MLAKVYSAAVYGVDAYEVEIEVNAAKGAPVTVIVGLPDIAVKESRDRVLTAVHNSGYRSPQGRTTINLAPADVKKEGPSFDLPIALGTIAVGEEIRLPDLEQYAFVGELALDGAIRGVNGVLPIALEARKKGRRAIMVPEENAHEAAIVTGITTYGVRNLRQVFEFLRGNDHSLTPVITQSIDEVHPDYEVDFADVRGQYAAKRAIEVAVAGGHNLLMIGPPGSGKSMLAKRLPTIMPPMTFEEALETTKVHSICGFLGNKRSFINVRPFRSPHHTISDAGLLGGGSNPSPGEVTLAHNGVLFMDELPEFKRATLEVLRQPLEDKQVTVSRAAGSMTFPADFMMVAALNPCPCGYFGDLKRECRCSLNQVQRYRQRISGPLLDRIDLHIEVPAVQFKELTSTENGESSASIRERILAARAIQQKRFAKSTQTRCNARMTSRQLKTHGQLDEQCRELLRMAMSELNLSARAHDRILKVSRTIADLEAAQDIGIHHLSEAIQYRTLDRSLWT